MKADTRFAGVDRAVFVAALLDRLRTAGLPVAGDDSTSLAQGLDRVETRNVGQLYWLCRISVVRRQQDIAIFNREFSRVFLSGDELPGPQATAAIERAATGTDDDAGYQSVPKLTDGDAVHGGGLPWLTRVPSIDGLTSDEDDNDDDESDEDDNLLGLPEPQPSPEQILATTPFDLLDPADLARLGIRIEQMMVKWPTRPSRRLKPSQRGAPDLRRTMADARKSGGEPLRLARRHRSRQRRPVVALLDVSGSMQAYARAYLHLMRTLTTVGDAEVFAFATNLTRLTPALRLSSAEQALAKAEELVVDRYGGTMIATAFADLLRHRIWGSKVRGAVTIVVSDGWDSDDPAELGRRTAALARRSHRLIWVNPRVAAEGYQPSVAGMAAAKPHCDEFLAGNTLNALDEILDAISQ